MKKKIGITSNNENFSSLFVNGLKFNVLLWYDFFELCGYEVFFITTSEKPMDSKYKCIIRDDKEKIIKENISIVFYIDYYDLYFHSFCINNSIKNIMIILGSTYHNDVHAVFDERYGLRRQKYAFDEIWISPHFKFTQEYLKIKFKTEKIFVCPYIWREDLVKTCKPLTDLSSLKVGIVEPNLDAYKFCLIPVSICEKANKIIKSLKIFNTFHLKENTFLKDFLLHTDLVQSNRLTVEKRFPITNILSEWCNCIVSYVEDCDLNYIFFECFYLGIPLVHNSPMLKDYGYYYPRLDVSKGAEQLNNVLKNHDRESYIKKHIPLLEKYSVNNPLHISWVKSRLNNELSFDFCV